MTEGQAALWRAGLALWSKDGWRGISQTLRFSPRGGGSTGRDGSALPRVDMKTDWHTLLIQRGYLLKALPQLLQILFPTLF